MSYHTVIWFTSEINLCSPWGRKVGQTYGEETCLPYDGKLKFTSRLGKLNTKLPNYMGFKRLKIIVLTFMLKLYLKNPHDDSK